MITFEYIIQSSPGCYALVEREMLGPKVITTHILFGSRSLEELHLYANERIQRLHPMLWNVKKITNSKYVISPMKTFNITRILNKA